MNILRKGLSSNSNRILRHQSISVRFRSTVNVVFLRNAQSTWNKDNLFMGWTDTPLTKHGVIEARLAGKFLKDSDFAFDEVYTSVLRRATKTAWMAMQELELEWVPVYKDWRLNEQHFGALVGKNKKNLVEYYGKERVKFWNCGWDDRKPPMQKDHPNWPGKDNRYRYFNLHEDNIPLSESLRDVSERTLTFWEEIIKPKMKSGKRILIVTHGNTIRSLVKCIDNISETDIVDVSIPRAWPLVYTFDRSTLTPIVNEERRYGKLSGYFLGDQETLEKTIEREYKQSFDLSVSENLEDNPDYLSSIHDRWKKFLNLMIGTPTTSNSTTNNLQQQQQQHPPPHDELSWSKNDKDDGTLIHK